MNTDIRTGTGQDLAPRKCGWELQDMYSVDHLHWWLVPSMAGPMPGPFDGVH